MTRTDSTHAPDADPAQRPAAAAAALPLVHRGHGLTLRSCIDLSGGRGEARSGPVDGTIEEGETPSDLGPGSRVGPKFEARPGVLLVKTLTIADLLVQDGRSIRVSPKPAANPWVVRDLVASWGLGALLAQRGRLALHASAVASSGGGAALFCGPAGVGKSTLAGLLARRGFRILDDNLAVLELGEGREPLVHPGFGQIRLCDDTFEILGRSRTGLFRLADRRGKSLVNLGDDERASGPGGLCRIYALRRGSHLARRTIHGSDKLRRLQADTFVARFLPGLGRLPGHFELWLRLARQVEMVELVIPADRSPDAFADLVARELEDAAPRSAGLVSGSLLTSPPGSLPGSSTESLAGPLDAPESEPGRASALAAGRSA